uniref:non-specific serine/threonine protein kinase n=1 Tax=Physcomitrium patens TaxID=3218 RepID=A0A7I4FQE4_PHYPA
MQLLSYEEVLGRGSIKVVYNAFDKEQGSKVSWNHVALGADANPWQVHDLKCKMLQTLQHSKIISCKALFSSGTLADYYKLYGKHLKINTLKSWVKQIQSELEYLHTWKPPIVHRDIKCDNIFINGNTGEVKIGDMGFVKEIREVRLDMVVGTPEFMAPKLLDLDYNQLVDVYALGMSVLEMLTREYPYEECKNMREIFMKKINNPEARAFIMKCLALESKRPSVRDLRWDPFLVSSTICLSSSSTSFAHHSFGNAESSDGAQNSSSSSSSGRGAVTLLLVCSATLSFEHISINALFFLSSHYESTHLLLIVCV